MIATQVIYADVPAEVSRVSAYQWRQNGQPLPLQLSIVRDGTRISLTLPAVTAAIVLLHRADGSYLLDGPVAPADGPVTRPLEETWRRTVTGSAPLSALPGSTIEWVPVSGAAGKWPACGWIGVGTWHCLGVPIDTPGVAVSPGGDRLLSAVVSADSTPALRESHWGRLLIVSDRGAGPPPRLRVTGGRAVVPPARRAGTVRLESALLADLRVTTAAPAVVWLAGDSSPPNAWVEVRSARSGPLFLAVADVAEGAWSMPLYVTLEDATTVAATVVSARNETAAGALVTAFRLLDPAPARASTGESPPRRVIASETIADAEGKFRIDGLGEADYEIVAWHPQFGRGSVLLRPGDRPTLLRLSASGIARGRVLTSGKPAAGVDVVAMPDPAAYSAALDPIDLKGGDARSGPDGRFSLALAPGGGGELRIGGGRHGVTRVPLPRASLPIVELGDIELGSPVMVRVALDQDSTCQIRATGPISRPGLQIVIGTRTGPAAFVIRLPEAGSWEFGLLCGREDRALAPAVVKITASEAPQQLRFIVR